MLRNNQYLLLLALMAFILSCSSSNNTKQSDSKKFHVLPVFLTVSGIEKDTSIKKIVAEAFAKYKIELIGKEDMLRLSENEAKRVSQKVFTKDANLPSADDMLKAMSREHSYATNNLNIVFQLEEKDDSLIILKASWSNMAFPPDFGRPAVKAKPREIDLANLSYSRKENIYAIVDSILYSKELK